MPNAFKQFTEKGTAFLKNQFQLTRLRLTAMYAVLLLIILIISSVTTHSFFSDRIRQRFRSHHFLPPTTLIIEINETLRNEAQEELVFSLLFVNGIVFLAAVGLSYVLAGITLHPIQEAYEKQKQFFGDASHELRTPLAILQTDLENELANPRIKRSEQEHAKSHLEEVQRMSNIVKDLLLISRLDDQVTTGHKESINVYSLIATAVERLKPYAAQHIIKLVAPNKTPQQPLLISANNEHILQAVSNVIKNAIEYSSSGDTVTVTLDRDSKNVHIDVRDTGIGIKPSEIPKLFDRFYRVEKSRSKTEGGSGLGLSIVQSITQSYGGSISIQSKPGHGTIVRLSFPLHATQT